VVGCDRRDEAGDVDAGGAGSHAGRRRIRPAALEAAVRLEDGRFAVERRVQLAEHGLRRSTHHR
jgi:hypothetical protein